MTTPYRRLGPDSKCPACGWGIDSDAYRCPKCLIYFCWKCRKRIPKGDAQYQCVNQACPCHGKLLCPACTVIEPVFKMFQGSKLITPGKPAWGWAVCVVAAITSCSAGSALSGLFRYEHDGLAFFLAVLIALLIYGLACVLLPKPLWGTDDVRESTGEESRQVGEHRCCIQCRTPAQDLG